MIITQDKWTRNLAIRTHDHQQELYAELFHPPVFCIKILSRLIRRPMTFAAASKLSELSANSISWQRLDRRLHFWVICGNVHGRPSIDKEGARKRSAHEHWRHSGDVWPTSDCYRYLNHAPLSTFNTYQVAKTVVDLRRRETEGQESGNTAAVDEVRWAGSTEMWKTR